MRKYVLLLILFACMNAFNAMASEQLPAKFFATVGITSIALSPDGKNVAVTDNINGKQKLLLINTQSAIRQELMKVSDYADVDATIQAIDWIDNNHIAVQFSTIRKGVEDLLDTKIKKQLLIVQIPVKKSSEAIIKSVRTSGWIVDMHLGESTFLYAKSGFTSKVYKITPNQLAEYREKLTKLDKIDGGQFVMKNVVASVEGFAVRWFTSVKGDPIAVLSITGKNELSLTRLNIQEDKDSNQKELTSNEGNKVTNQENTDTLKTWKMHKFKTYTHATYPELQDRLIPIEVADTENTFYCLDFSEDEESSVYKVNFATNTIELIYETSAYKILSLILGTENNTLLGIRVLDQGAVRDIYLENTSREEKNISSQNTKPKSSFDLAIAYSLDGNTSLHYRESDNTPGHYYVESNLPTNNKVKIGDVYPAIPHTLPTHQIEGSVNVEGLEIPYILNLPTKKQTTPFPLIVLPHGGPIGIFDDRYFNLEPQFYAIQGTAVLRVNYRGSGGHSKEFREAGKQQFGNLILSDILAATKKAISREDIDSSRVCIIGHSYGGYAATLLSILHPEIFKCGVSVGGISDINLLLNEVSNNVPVQKWHKSYIGDPARDYQKLKAKSPAYLADQLQIPLFIIHGSEDNVVDIEQAHRLRLMLEKSDKQFEWLVFENEGHSFTDPQNRVQLYKSINQFIEKNL